MAKARRQYNNLYPSVTQVLDVLRKKGLEYWFKVNTAAYCDEKSTKGKEVGTQIHKAIQDHIELREVKIETDYAVEVTNALKSFMLFKKEHPEITLHKSEMMLTNEEHKYNGTLDVSGEVSTTPAIGDWKTGEAKDKDKPKIYPEHKAQLAAYIKAYNHVEKKDINKGFIVVLAKDKVAYDYYVMDAEEINAEFNEVFLPALRICSYYKSKKEY